MHASEFGAWIGLAIYMGVATVPALSDYLKHDGIYPFHHISEFMSQMRFKQIKRYYHIASPDAPDIAPEGRRLWHSKVDPIFKQLTISSQSYHTPSTNVAVDEYLIRCTGRSMDTYKMCSKPIEQGFKFHCLADHGYMWDFLPTPNQAGPDPVPSIEGLSDTGSIVYQLLNTLSCTPIEWSTWMVFTHQFHCLQTCDRHSKLEDVVLFTHHQLDCLWI